MKKVLLAMVMVASTLALAGCGPEVGSEAWCADLKEKPKGDWSANEASEYAKSCLFK